jgi:hypothetical protein
MCRGKQPPFWFAKTAIMNHYMHLKLLEFLTIITYNRIEVKNYLSGRKIVPDYGAFGEK